MTTISGIIYAVDNVLIPPFSTLDTLMMIPEHFSTFTSGLLRAEKVRKELSEGTGITFFVPSNHAWRSLGMTNLLHLFSPSGKKNLEKILAYHVGVELAYMADIKKHRQLKIKTLEGSELRVSIKSHHHSKHEDAKHHQGGHAHIYVNGESRVVFPDFPTENGAMHVINEVLVPDDVELPEPVAFSE